MFAVPKTRPPYPGEFRRDAVALVRRGRSVRDVAESLGVSGQSLHIWSSSTNSIAENATTG
jgi:transposase